MDQTITRLIKGLWKNPLTVAIMVTVMVVLLAQILPQGDIRRGFWGFGTSAMQTTWLLAIMVTLIKSAFGGKKS